MAQIFHPASNTIAKASIFGAVFIALGVLWFTAQMVRSSYNTEVNVAQEQPVQFSHEHHVSGLGIDCRYCHTSVEEAAFAGMPSTKTCMTCHSQIWTNADLLEPVRASWREDTPIRWNRVHDLPDFVQFNHGIHVQKGIGCYECHGNVSGMPLMWKAHSLHMEWCLDCHRAPEKYIRPRDQVFNIGPWVPGAGIDRLEAGRELVKKYGVRSEPGSSGRMEGAAAPEWLADKPQQGQGGYEKVADDAKGPHLVENPHKEWLPKHITNCSVCHY